MLNPAFGAAAIVLAMAVEPAAAQQVRAGVLTCDVSAGVGLIITSRKQLSCAFEPDRAGLMREDYDGSITKFGLDLGMIGGGVMVWAVFTGTVAGPGFLAGDYVGASGEASLGPGVGANVLVGDSKPDGDAAAGLGRRADRDQCRGRGRGSSSRAPAALRRRGALLGRLLGSCNRLV